MEIRSDPVVYPILGHQPAEIPDLGFAEELQLDPPMIIRSSRAMPPDLAEAPAQAAAAAATTMHADQELETRALLHKSGIISTTTAGPYSALQISSSKFAEDDEESDPAEIHHLHPPIQSFSSSCSELASAVFNLATSIIGAGIMALPATMRVLGLPLGILSIVAMGLLSEISIEMVIFFTTQLNAWSYGDMVHGACGRIGRFISQLCIVVNNSGILIVYLIIIGDVVAGSSEHLGLLQQWAGFESPGSRKLVILLTMLFILAPLCCLKRIDSLRYSSAASVALAVVFVVLSSGVAIVKGIRGNLEKPRMIPSLGSQKSVLELLTVVPIMTNAFICHFNIQPIYAELKNRTAGRMNSVGRISTALCILIYLATAISGYLLFGQATASDVLTNFDQDLGISYSSILNGVIRLGYVIHLMLVFPVIHFSLRQNVDAIIFPNPKQILAENPKRFAALTIALLSLVFLGSTFIPNIWIAFQFTGATAGLSLGFIFPAIVALSLGHKKKRKKKWSREMEIVAWAMLLLAGISSFLGLATNIYNVATHHLD